MINIVLGLVSICLGIWGLVTYWWYIVDIIIAFFPLVLLGFGIIALLAGIKNTGLKATVMGRNNNQESTESTNQKKDE
jgi:F0F1-type ATP synthase assembly protein I